MSNLGLVKFCEQNNIDFEATKVGDRYVLEKMLECNYKVGGEQSGHVIFKDFANTGDGELTSIQILNTMSKDGKKLSELASVMKRYPQVLINVKVKEESAGYVSYILLGIITFSSAISCISFDTPFASFPITIANGPVKS